MPYRLFALALLLLAIMTPAAIAQDDNPTVAILRFGPLGNTINAESGILNALESYGFITEMDHRILEQRVGHAAENINIIWGDANFDLATASLMMEDALDAEPDALVTIGAQTTLSALAATLEMDEPTPVIFVAVSEPFGLGIAESACEKPAHVTGSRTTPSYEFALAALKQQAPDMSKIGTIYSVSQPAGVFGAEEMTMIAEGMGIEVMAKGAVDMPDLRLAMFSLLEDGAEAIILPLDSLVGRGLPILTNIANEAGIPIFFPNFSAVFYGATIGAGSGSFYQHGINGGVMLAALLNGELDIASTGIATTGYLGIGVNLDSAEAQGVEVDPDMLDEASLVYEGDQATQMGPQLMQELASLGVIVPLEERQEKDAAWLAGLQCEA